MYNITQSLIVWQTTTGSRPQYANDCSQPTWCNTKQCHDCPLEYPSAGSKPNVYMQHMGLHLHPLEGRLVLQQLSQPACGVPPAQYL